MPRSPKWTPEDLFDLRYLCERRKNHRLNWTKIRKRFPNRSADAIYKQMRVHGMCQPVGWTPQEDDFLRKGWNDLSLPSLKKGLPGRNKVGIYGRARKLGLSAGTPQGMVSVKSLSEDPAWGYDYYKTLRIFKAADLRIRTFGYAGKKSGVKYVEVDEARLAAAEWERSIAEERVGKETPKEASTRLHVREGTLRGWLTLEGLMPPKEPGVKHRFWAAPAVFDGLYARNR